jgi:hypothetical protein
MGHISYRHPGYGGATQGVKGLIDEFNSANALDRVQEKEADLFGARLACQAGFDPVGLIILMRHFAAIERSPSSFMKNHPSGTERIGYLQQEVENCSLHVRSHISPTPGIPDTVPVPPRPSTSDNTTRENNNAPPPPAAQRYWVRGKVILQPPSKQRIVIEEAMDPNAHRNIHVRQFQFAGYWLNRGGDLLAIECAKGYRVVDLGRITPGKALEPVEEEPGIGYRFDVLGKAEAGFELVCEADQ